MMTSETTRGPFQHSSPKAPAMPPETVALLRESFALLSPRLDEFGAAFYRQLFESNPALRNVFHGDMEKQTHALTAMLELIIKLLDMRDKVVPLIHYLGDRHRAMQVRREYYAPFGEALIATLAAFLGDKFTPELRRAWVQAYRYMADNMR